MLEKMKHLSQVANMKQVKPLSYALFPGYHCPLMGAMLTIKEIDNSVMVVIGPDECAFYTKMATSGGNMQAKGCEIVSVVLDQHDVTFGCQDKMDEAFAELMDEYKPKAVYLVTTCVVEVIGDDIESMARNYSEQYGLPVIVVHAENFKTDDHLPGIEHTMEASIDMMEPQEVCDCAILHKQKYIVICVRAELQSECYSRENHLRKKFVLHQMSNVILLCIRWVCHWQRKWKKNSVHPMWYLSVTPAQSEFISVIRTCMQFWKKRYRILLQYSMRK